MSPAAWTKAYRACRPLRTESSARALTEERVCPNYTEYPSANEVRGRGDAAIEEERHGGAL